MKKDGTTTEELLPAVIEKPWGHERILAKTDTYVVKEIYVKPNSRLSLQYHEEKDETMMLVSGQGFLEISRVTFTMEYMSPHHIAPGREHRLFTKDQDCLVVEVSSTQLDDVVRVEDDYGREGQ